MSQYYDNFIQHGYGDSENAKWRDLDDATLKELGIKKMAHRKRILLDQINTGDFDFGEDKSQIALMDDELYRKKEKNELNKTPNGATPNADELYRAPSELTLNGIAQPTTAGQSDEDDEEGSGQDEDDEEEMDDLLYQKPD